MACLSSFRLPFGSGRVRVPRNQRPRRNVSRSMKTRTLALTDWRFVLALSLLIANDRFLKRAWPGFVTGKLSDVVGPVVAAVLGATLLGVLVRFVDERRAIERTTEPPVIHLSIAVVAAFMSSMPSNPLPRAAFDWLVPMRFPVFVAVESWTPIPPSSLSPMTFAWPIWPIVALALFHNRMP